VTISGLAHVSGVRGLKFSVRSPAVLGELRGELPAGSAGRALPVSWLRCTCLRGLGLAQLAELNLEPAFVVLVCSFSSMSLSLEMRVCVPS